MRLPFLQHTLDLILHLLRPAHHLQPYIMADALLSLLSDRLASLVCDEVSLVVGVEYEIQSLTNTLQILGAVVADAEQRQLKEKRVGIWLEELKNVAYELDDVLDEWSTALLRSQLQRAETSSKLDKRKVISCFHSTCSRFTACSGRRGIIALKMKAVKQQIDEIASQMHKFNFTPITNRLEPAERLTTSFSAVGMSTVFGLNDDMNTMLAWLLGQAGETSSGIDTISLVGMGGIGKTTLAQLAFNHAKVAAHFNPRIWVCVSDMFVPSRIFRLIVEALQLQRSDLLDTEAVQQQIQTVLEGKKFLLVLDDVWNEDYELWQQLNNCLECGGGGSRILVTTRNASVAKMMGSRYIHNMNGLSKEECRQLFFHMAFLGKSMEKIEELQKIGEQIVDKCKGLPLAIKALGSMLQFKDRKEDWENVLYSEMWERGVFDGDIYPVLFLSYSVLPPALKLCFSYCAVFPKDHFIKVDELIKLWMAQGYLNSNMDRDMEILGRDYFENLATRSFFPDFDKDEEGNIVSCKMHDIVYEFAKTLTQNEFLILDDDCGNSSLQKARHATLSGRGTMRISFSTDDVKNLHTLLIMGSISSEIDGPLNSLEKFKHLRALDLSLNDSIIELPRDVSKCVHLRYLSLFQCNRLRVLPETLSELCNLQSLNVEGCGELRKLPRGITSLINLRHLLVDVYLSGLPKGIEKLTSLRTLSSFIVSEGGASEACKMEELKNLKELRGKLQLYGLGWVGDVKEVKMAELKSIKHLSGLKLDFRPSESQRVGMVKDMAEALQPHPNLKSLGISYYGATEWPWWMMEPRLLRLTHLHLHQCSCTCLPPLGELPHLEYLQISEMYGVKSVGAEFLGSASAIAFPRLRHLSFKGMREWENWALMEEGQWRRVMPFLCYLEIDGSPKLTTLPDLVIQSLQELTIRGCDLLAVKWGRESKPVDMARSSARAVGFDHKKGGRLVM